MRGVREHPRAEMCGKVTTSEGLQPAQGEYPFGPSLYTLLEWPKRVPLWGSCTGPPRSAVAAGSGFEIAEAAGGLTPAGGRIRPDMSRIRVTADGAPTPRGLGPGSRREGHASSERSGGNTAIDSHALDRGVRPAVGSASPSR